MSRRAIVVTAVAAATNVVVGWRLGYHAVSSYLLFWFLLAATLSSSVRITRRVFGPSDLPDVVIRTAVVAFGLIVSAGLILGGLGVIGRLSYGLFFAIVWMASFLVKGERTAIRGFDAPMVLTAVLVPALIYVVATGLVQSPMTLYDSLSYHLFFPARWLQEHRLSIIATPFSDEAQAYAPANGELFFLWLMVPFHGDLLARIGQLPFYLLGAVTLYALACRLGARPVHAAYVSVFYLIAKPVVEQAVGADVDLVCWATLFTSLYLGICAVDRNKSRDWLLWGLSLGLFFGTKYVALVFGPVVILLPLLRGIRVRQSWALLGIAALALPWYSRNWIAGGSPLYPSSLAIAGVTLAHGAYSHAAMMNSILHTSNLRWLPVMFSRAFGVALCAVWIPFGLIGAWRLAARRPRWPGLFLLIAPFVMALFCWTSVPDNLDLRFLVPAAMLSLLLLPFAFRQNRIWNGAIHVALIAGVVWVLMGWPGELNILTLPWPIGNWVAFDGTVARPYVWPFLGLGAVVGCLCSYRAQAGPLAAFARAGLFAPMYGVLLCVGVLVFGPGSSEWCRSDSCSLLNLSSTHISSSFPMAWQWMDGHVKGARVAYAGNNLPYPLLGAQLENRVSYVNIDHHMDWRFHDYDLMHRRHRPGALPEGMLAVSSGMLEPLAEPPQWQADAVRPRYERMEGERDAWVQNLRATGVSFLFVSALSPYDIDYMWHDADGFPIENEWARLEPQTFTLVYENARVRIFAVQPAASPVAS